VAKTVEMKIPADIEFRVIANAFGILIASAGLLAGEMLRQRSFDYWLEDIVPLLILLWSGFRLFRNFLSTMIAYQDVHPQVGRPAPGASWIPGEKVIAGHIASKPSYSADKVVEEVAKRIEAQKADAVKRNKSNH
jgi:hypothetical protein